MDLQLWTNLNQAAACRYGFSVLNLHPLSATRLPLMPFPYAICNFKYIIIMKRVFLKTLVLLCLLLAGLSGNAAVVRINLSGLEQGDSAVVSISSETFIASQKIKSNGIVRFDDVIPGLHSVKAETAGYNLPATQLVRVREDGSVEPMTDINIAITKMDDDPDSWHHVWESDGSIGGYTTTSHVNTRPEVEFLGKRIVPSDVPSMAILMDQYHVILVDEEMPWTQEYAYRLLETLKTLPRNYGSLGNTKFILSDERITDDLSLQKENGGNIVRISRDVFAYANPFLVNLDGVRGRFFSKRLHHALAKFVTDFGEDKGAVDHILDQRFGLSVNVPDYNELTAGTTGEDYTCFQEFHPSELVAVINMLEELPEGFHVTPNLKYLVRRLNGHPHPLYPEAAAVSWCKENGYIEFMVSDKGSAFSGNNEQFDTQRLILHEKAHFLWAFTFPEEIKSDWAEVGGWYRDPNAGNDPDSGWSTTKTTEFVSAYAHAHNPNEDMAESIAYYLKDPEKLMSRAPEKYDFIRDRIMHGTRYISSIPDHLTFEVLNLFPDYDYPGKIKKVDITVTGAPDEDKQLTFDLYLNHIEGFDDGASGAFTRIMSPTFIDEEGIERGTYIDLYFTQVEGDPWHLRGSATINKYSKAGYWVPGDISVTDLVGNSRYEGRNDCISNIYINNSLEDLIAPVYVKGSLTYELSDITIEGHHEQLLSVKFQAYDNINIRDVYGGLYTGVDSNHMPGWNTVVDKDERTIEIQYRIRDYFYSTDYYIASICITDEGGLTRDILFSEDPSHEPIQKIHITTPNPDYEHPEIDLNRMYVYAEPTHPEAPDGETKVNISYYVRDNISGFSVSNITLRDPQGIQHFYWANNGPVDSEGYFAGDPTAWKRYEQTIILPQGSAPGIWGIAAMGVRDHAYNDYDYNFVETLIFEPDDSEDGWELFAEIEDSSLVFGLDSAEGAGFGFTWRIIHEESGMEICGDSYGSLTRASGQLRADISSMPGGSLILIVQALGEDGGVVAVKSRRVSYSGPFIPVESIVLHPSQESFTVGENTVVSAAVLPENATDGIEAWSSSDESVALVDENGEVTFVGVGKVTITASCGEVSSECTLKSYPKAGDANWNGSITVTDAVDITNYVVRKKDAPEDWDKDEWLEFYTVGANANESEDGRITFADASAAVRLALTQPAPAAARNRIRDAYGHSDEQTDALVISSMSETADGRTSIAVRLDDSREYVALQADIVTPEGWNIEVKAGGRAADTHSLETMRFDDTHMRVALFNLANQAFADNDEPILEIIADTPLADATGLVMSNILAADSEANEYVLGSRIEVETGVEGVADDGIVIGKVSGGVSISNAVGRRVEIHTLDGQTVRSFIAKDRVETINLSSGLYLVKAGGKTVKVML